MFPGFRVKLPACWKGTFLTSVKKKNPQLVSKVVAPIFTLIRCVWEFSLIVNYGNVVLLVGWFFFLIKAFSLIHMISMIFKLEYTKIQSNCLSSHPCCGSEGSWITEKVMTVKMTEK